MTRALRIGLALGLVAGAGCTTPGEPRAGDAGDDAPRSTDAPADAVAESDAPDDAPLPDAPPVGDAGPLDPFAGCPDDALRIDGAFGMTAIDTADYGAFGNNVMVVRIEVPATATGTSVRSSSWVEYVSGPTARHAVFSTRPCSFDPEHALRTGTGSRMVSVDQIGFSFRYTFGPATTTAASLTPGATYYINARNQFSDGSPTCTISDCRMRGGLPP